MKLSLSKDKLNRANMFVLDSGQLLVYNPQSNYEVFKEQTCFSLKFRSNFLFIICNLITNYDVAVVMRLLTKEVVVVVVYLLTNIYI